MSRNSRRIALYEVIGKNGLKSSQNRGLSRLGSSSSQTKPPIDAKLDESAGMGVSQTRPWSNRPKWLRLYGNRIEISLSWQVAVIAILAICSIFLVFFRLGRMTAVTNIEEIGKSAVDVAPAKPAAVVRSPVVGRVEPGSYQRPKTPRMVVPMGDNVIVIASYELASHLQPVKSYFAGFGIDTEIRQVNGRYLLTTTQRYDNPEKAGTDGYVAKQKIIKIGAGYKPPKSSGFDSFAPNLFSDAYGMKVKSSN